MSNSGLSDRVERAQPILERYRELLFSRARFDCRAFERDLLELAEISFRELPQLLCPLSSEGRYRHVAAFCMQHMSFDGPGPEFKSALARFYGLEHFEPHGAATAKEYWKSFQKWTESRKEAVHFLRGVLEKCYEVLSAIRSEGKKETPNFRALQSKVALIRDSVDEEVYRLKQYVAESDRFRTRQRDPSQVIHLCEFDCLVKVQHKLHDLPSNPMSTNFVDEIHTVEAESDVGLSYVEEICPD